MEPDAPLAVALSQGSLDKLMPLHLLLSPEGRIIGHGPTLGKLLEGQVLIGRNLFDAFELRRPSGIGSMSDLLSRAGEKLRLNLRGRSRTMAFRGLALEMADGNGVLVNLSFGIGVVDAVRVHALTDGDFAPTDLAMEMMYLVEAKTGAMGALHNLAKRLEGDKKVAEAEALTDVLTGLCNRRALSMALDGLTRARTPFGLMHIDLDYFKAVNDTLGHAAGDHVLRQVARILQQETRAEDTVARVGGDEFVLVFPSMTDGLRLEVVARRIIEQLSEPLDFEGQPCRISASVGIVMSTQYDQPNPARMQNDADEALYASKRGGRGQARVYRPAGGDRRSA